MKRSTSKKAKSKSSTKVKSQVKAKALPVQIGGLNRELLRSFTEFMREEGLASFTFKSKDFEVELKFAGTEATSFVPAQSLQSAPQSSAPQHVVHNRGIETPDSFAASPVEEKRTNANTRIIKSPFVGTFYRSAAPGKPTFVDIGSVVNSGDALCILEAMKLMNEIEAEFKCKILKILVDDSSPVEYGESLFEVEVL